MSTYEEASATDLYTVPHVDTMRHDEHGRLGDREIATIALLCMCTATSAVEIAVVTGGHTIVISILLMQRLGWRRLRLDERRYLLASQEQIPLIWLSRGTKAIQAYRWRAQLRQTTTRSYTISYAGCAGFVLVDLAI